MMNSEASNIFICIHQRAERHGTKKSSKIIINSIAPSDLLRLSKVNCLSALTCTSNDSIQTYITAENEEVQTSPHKHRHSIYVQFG